ncbi:DUF2849 domain-containing protein [Lacibacterium aquatile]|uniref:DUF2849 domain-containing protein n=1 Tax=Lacibacterium aquatile TaxID=1168082 RepID=A0ABW5DQQ5_9PROT
MASPHQQKLRIDGPSLITGNRLGAGSPAYRTAEGDWSDDIAAAAVSEDAEVVLGWLDAAKADYRRIVGPYVARISPEGATLSVRERIRAKGPSVAIPGETLADAAA